MTTPANQPDLATWLRQQLDDDERTARAVNADADPLSDCWFDCTGGGHADHHLRWDPERVLAEVDAKRRILDEVVDEATGLDMQVDGEFRVGRRDEKAEPYLGDVLVRLLALPYADRPGYQERWRPA